LLRGDHLEPDTGAARDSPDIRSCGRQIFENDDFEFVFSAIARLDSVEVLKRPFPECLAMLPHPSGRGSMLCGMDAYQRLRDMTERALAQSVYTGKLETEAVFRELKKITVQRFVKEARELNTREADRALSAAVKAAAKDAELLSISFHVILLMQESPTHFPLGRFDFNNAV
jgi:hypothetical protein